jgi:hypothetical protein
MHDDSRPLTEEGTDHTSPAQEPPGEANVGLVPENEGRPSGTAGANAQTWLNQLQAIIENLASQSAPVIREIGAKAAEVAALAAERAGPLAQRAGEATAQASSRVGERSRVLAADLRRGPDGGAGQGAARPDASRSMDPETTDGADSGT